MRFRTQTVEGVTFFSSYLQILFRILHWLDRHAEKVIDKSWSKAHGDQ